MKSSEPKTTAATHQSQQDAKSPFFKKDGEGMFFSESSTDVLSPKTAEPFFSPSNIQPKLKIGQPNDKYEKEADATAERVVAQLSNLSSKTQHQTNNPSYNNTSTIQSKATDESFQLKEEQESEEISMKEMEVQRKPIFESAEKPPEDDNVQRQASDSNIATPSPDFQSQLNASKGGGVPLSNDTRSSMESGFGADFSGVRVHTDDNAQSLSNQIGAQAFTHGSDIYFNEGKYDTGSTDGKTLLAHELTHTVQQGGSIQRKPKISNTTNDVQTFPGAQSVRNWMADKADQWIPAYPLLSVVIGYDLIRGETVARNRDNILKGVFSIINPIGSILYQRLKENGIIDQAFEFINGQLNALGLTLGKLKQSFSNFWDATDLLRWDPFEYNYNLFKKHFGGYFRNLVTLAGRIKNKVFAMVKDAFLKILVKLAKAIGGYDLLGDLLGYDPITGEVKQASTADILRGILKLPIVQKLGGDKLLAKLEEHKLIDKAANWMDKQWALLKSAFANMKNIATKFVSLFSFETLRAPMKFVNEIKNDAIGFVTKVTSFFFNIATQVLNLIKEALIWLLKQFVDENTLGYDLVAVILGKDPLTGEKVARTPKNIIKGFLGLLPGGKALFTRFEETGAIDRITSWVLGAVEEFVNVLGMLKASFLNLWQTATIQNLFEPIPFFTRIVNLFKEPLIRIVAFVKDVITKIFEVLLQIMSFPFKMAQQIIANVKAAFESIKNDPIGFLMRMLEAVKEGFVKFFDNIGKHLLAGVTGWLFGQVAKAGIAVPKDLSLGSILGLVMDILDITVEKLWAKLVDKIGQEKVDKIRGGIDKLKGVWLFVKDVTQNGISAVWKFIKGQISNLWNMVVEEVKSWVITKVIQKVVAKLLSMLDPTGIMAVVNGFMGFFKAIQSFMEYFQQMLQIVNTFIGGMAEIAKGVIAKAAEFLENGLAKALPVALGFLANQVGLGNIGDKLGQIIQAVRGVIDKALTWLIDKAMKGIQGIMGLFGGGKKGKEDKKEEEEELPYPPEKAAKVAAGLAEIPEIEENWIKAGKLSREGAEDVARKIMKKHNVFKKFIVVDGKESWDYYFEASAGKTIENDNLKMEEDTIENLNDIIPSSKIDYKKGHSSNGIPRKSNSAVLFSSYDGKEVEGWINPKNKSIGNSARHYSELKSEVAARGSLYHAGHLLNHDVDGDGRKPENITPITAKANSDMKNGVEALLKSLKNSSNNFITHVNILVVYPSSPNPSSIIPAEGFLCKRLKFEVEELEFDISMVSNDEGKTFKEGMDFENAKILKMDFENWIESKKHSVSDVINDTSQWIDSPIGVAKTNLNRPTNAILRDAGITDEKLRRKMIGIIKDYPDYQSMTKEEIFQALTAANIEWSDEEIDILASASSQIGLE